MKNLIEKLTAETQDLKERYLVATKAWAQDEFSRIVDRCNWSDAEWARLLGVKTQMKKMHGYDGYKEYETFGRDFYNTREAGTYSRMKDESYRVKNMGKEEFLRRAERDAIKHYEGSIEKLANRIVKKGLNPERCTVENKTIGVNIECLVTDGAKTVRAWTIVASGPVQRPHYRYLVK